MNVPVLRNARVPVNRNGCVSACGGVSALNGCIPAVFQRQFLRFPSKKSFCGRKRSYAAAGFPAALFFAALSALNLLVSCVTADTPSYELYLKDGKTGAVYTRYNLGESGTFSVSFMHSVNLSVVEEGYRISDGSLILDWCLYSSFGAGVAAELENGQTLSYTEDNKMLVRGFNRPIPFLSYEISTVYDHFLHAGGAVINLTELGLKGKRVEFDVRPAR